MSKRFKYHWFITICSAADLSCFWSVTIVVHFSSLMGLISNLKAGVWPIPVNETNTFVVWTLMVSSVQYFNIQVYLNVDFQQKIIKTFTNKLIFHCNTDIHTYHTISTSQYYLAPYIISLSLKLFYTLWCDLHESYMSFGHF